MSKSYTGKCGCGEIKLAFEGDPMKAVFCYCTDCQSDTGSDKWFGLWVANDNLEFTEGEPRTFTRSGSSGMPVHKKFCGTCGTTMGIDVVAGGFYSVAASLLDQKNEFSPTMAIYTASAVDWAVYPEGVPKYDTFPTSPSD